MMKRVEPMEEPLITTESDSDSADDLDLESNPEPPPRISLRARKPATKIDMEKLGGNLTRKPVCVDYKAKKRK